MSSTIVAVPQTRWDASFCELPGIVTGISTLRRTRSAPPSSSRISGRISAVDWRRGRLYIPLAERDAAGARDVDLDAARITPAWQQALVQATARTRDLFARGRPVCDGVHGRLRYELRLTWLGAIEDPRPARSVGLRRIQSAALTRCCRRSQACGGADHMGQTDCLTRLEMPIAAWRHPASAAACVLL